MDIVATTTTTTMTAAPKAGAAVWTGRVLSTLAVLFLLMDGVMKLFNPPIVAESMVKLGYPTSETFGIGVAVLVCTLLYVIPRTSVLGAILITGFLGGATATNVRVEAPLFGNILFPSYVALFVWLGLWLREPRLQALLPLRK